MEARELAKIICTALQEKKAEDIKVIEIRDISIIADYFIIANGTNTLQVQALVDTTRKELGKQGIEPKRIEGANTSSWILLDYGDIIVHIFSKEDRLFYDLERIWRDGKEIPVRKL